MFQITTKRTAKITAMTKRVSFSTVSIRNYDITVGDSPSVSSGIPLSLDWVFVEETVVSLNEYESNRSRRCTFLLSAEQRRHKLIEGFGIRIKHISQGAHRRQAIRQSSHNGSKIIGKVVFLPVVTKNRRGLAPVVPCVFNPNVSSRKTNK
jgi:hypothetical protein